MRHRIGLNPSRKFLFANLTSGDSLDHPDFIALVRIEAPAVEMQEHGDSQYAGTFVTINERMIADDAVTVHRCEVKTIRVPVAGERMERSGQRALEERLITNTTGATETGERLRMQGANYGRGQPAWLLHFASSRIASRWRRM